MMRNRVFHRAVSYVPVDKSGTFVPHEQIFNVLGNFLKLFLHQAAFKSYYLQKRLSAARSEEMLCFIVLLCLCCVSLSKADEGGDGGSSSQLAFL